MQNKIILEIFNNKSIDAYCKSLDMNNFDELKSELIIQLYKMNEEKLTAYYNNNCLTYICFTIIKRIKFGTITDTGVFYKKFDLMNDIKISGNYADDNWESQINYSENLIQAEKEKEDLFCNLESAIKNLHWYSKTLFEMYYFEDMTLKMISEKTGINIKSIHYSIKTTKEKLKKILKKND